MSLQHKTKQLVSAACARSPLSTVARLCEISTKTLQRQYQTDFAPSQRHVPHEGKITDEHLIFLRAFIDTHPTATLKDIKLQLYQKYAIDVSISTICRHFPQITQGKKLVSNWCQPISNEA